MARSTPLQRLASVPCLVALPHGAVRISIALKICGTTCYPVLLRLAALLCRESAPAKLCCWGVCSLFLACQRELEALHSLRAGVVGSMLACLLQHPQCRSEHVLTCFARASTQRTRQLLRRIALPVQVRHVSAFPDLIWRLPACTSDLGTTLGLAVVAPYSELSAHG